ncbi:hypothetical protein Taro_036827 [Colocasia esculenta]|uniref:Protein kinase domain-containing protein n=1 Tax=Colocasia esculenta TaxID=4460 RepID=A0A843W7X7_COLES|nr:hypothetical protein [Colocasia esculenta]
MRGRSTEWVRGQCLGRGSTAAVYLASYSAQQGYFAVKSTELSRSAPLKRERKILSSLCSPHVISCLGSDVTEESDGRVLHNLFLEYVPGGSLAEAVKKQGFLDERVTRVYTRGILDGLAYLHSRGIVHCDVKGHNVLVGADDRTVKLADFGCARRVDDGGDGTALISGTPLYMAPEVARGEEQGPAADIWALGCTVIEMATGCPPWSDVEDPVAAIHRIAFSTEVPKLPCNFSDDARDFLGRCLNRDLRQRWSAEELLKHPFVDNIKEFNTGHISDSKGISPKSTLDQDFWDSWPPEEENDDDHGKEAKPESLPLGYPQARLRQLVGGAHAPPPSPTMDENSCWITVRIGVPSRDLQSSTRGSFLSEEAAAGEEGSSRYGDGRPSPSAVEAASLPCNPSPNCYFVNDVTDQSCVTSVLREGHALVSHHNFLDLITTWERSVGSYVYDICDGCGLSQEFEVGFLNLWLAAYKLILFVMELK